jgi:hypothetical protein
LVMRVWRGIGAAALLVLPATGFPARAAADSERVHVQLTAPKGCADQATFLRALRKRTARFQIAGDGEPARRFAATVTQTESTVQGRLEIQGPGTEVSLRSVSGKTCEEVVAALAFMTALAIDASAPNVPLPSASAPNAPSPTAATSRARSPATEPPLPLAAAAPRTAAIPAAATAAPPPTPSPTPHRDPSRAENPPAAPPPWAGPALTASAATPVAARWKWSAGVQGHASFRVSPTLGLGGSLFVEAAAPGMSLLGPVLRGGLFVNHSNVTIASGAGAELEWGAALVEGCPIRLALVDSRVTLHPCVAFHLGILRGRGRGLDRPKTTTDFWPDLGPVARIRVAFFPRLFLEAQGMLVFPLRRLAFDVEDAGPTRAPTTLFSVPALGVLAGIGVAYEFR